jgi:hypothetical protein
MKQKIQEIIDKHSIELQKQRDKRIDLIKKIEFCRIHGFDEEARILCIKESAMSMPMYDMEYLIKDLERLISIKVK